MDQTRERSPLLWRTLSELLKAQRKPKHAARIEPLAQDPPLLGEQVRAELEAIGSEPQPPFEKREQDGILLALARAQELLREGSHQEVADLYRDVVHSDPDNVAALAGLAKARLILSALPLEIWATAGGDPVPRSQGVLESSMSLLGVEAVRERRLSLDPLHVDLLTLSATLQVMQGDIPEAMRMLQEIVDWGHLPGTVLYWALKDGKVLYDATD